MISCPELDSNPLIGSEWDSGCDIHPGGGGGGGGDLPQLAMLNTPIFHF